jgi:TonB family protein
MKYLLLLFLYCTYQVTLGQSKDSTKVFLNEEFETSVSSDGAAFYELTATSPDVNGIYETRTFFIDGRIYKSGYVNNLTSKLKVGTWTWWYENEQKSQMGDFIEHKKNGEWISWREDGSMNSKQSFENGLRNGESEYFFDNGNRSGKVLFKNDQRVKEEYWESDGTLLSDVKVANQPPSFPGGKDKFYQYIRDNLERPKSARKKKLKGTVKVVFIVSRDGSIKNITVLKGVSPELDKEAIKVISEMPKWREGRSMNRPVDARMVIPISF